VTLGALGVYRLIHHRHVTGGGMGVGMWGLTAWSFLMATCHGAGLMVLPVFLGMAAPAEARAATPRARPQRMPQRPWRQQWSTEPGTHGNRGGGLGGVHENWRRMLRKAWFNLDLIWAVALIATGF